MPSVAFDAIWVIGGDAAVKALSQDGVAKHYVLEAYKHLKAIGTCPGAKTLIDSLHLDEDEGLVVGDPAKFIKAIGQHRVWAREPKAKAVPA